MPVRLVDRKERAAELLLDIGAVHYWTEKPFIYTSGWAGPVYIDCRKLISTPLQRREIIQLFGEELDRHIGRENFDVVAGGETAGIPFAALIAEYFLSLVAMAVNFPAFQTDYCRAVSAGEKLSL